MKYHPLRKNILQLSIVAALSLTTGAQAALYWAGTPAGNAAVGGPGNWSDSTELVPTANWASMSGGPADSVFPGPSPTPADAVFEGTTGGSVVIQSDLVVGNITYSPAAALYTIVNNGNAVSVNGGVTNSSASVQAFTNNADLTFAGGTVNRLNVLNNGTLTFQNAAATNMGITGGGTTVFSGTSSAANTSVASALDISGLTGTSLTLSSLTLAGNSAILANKTLNLTDLTLGSDSVLTYSLGGAADGRIALTGPGTFTSTLAGTLVSVTTGPSFVQGKFSIITFDPSVTLVALDANNFNLDPDQQDDYRYLFTVDGDSVDLTLVAIPEVSSSLIPLLGAIGLFAFRRRSGVRAALAIV